MCGRFAQPRSSEELARIFHARSAAELPGGRFNVAPTDELNAVIDDDGERVVAAFRWGLVPHWADDRRGAARRINARGETVERMPAFRAAFRRRRCIIPADAFYEWRRDADGGRPAPFAIERADEAPMAFAGLAAAWRDPASGERLRTATIVTTAANPLVATIHDRMPVILEPDAWDAWLDPHAPLDLVRGLLAPISAVALRMRPVSPAVNDVRNDGPQLLATVAGA